jgi:hypothetical protein
MLYCYVIGDFTNDLIRDLTKGKVSFEKLLNGSGFVTIFAIACGWLL